MRLVAFAISTLTMLVAPVVSVLVHGANSRFSDLQEKDAAWVAACFAVAFVGGHVATRISRMEKSPSESILFALLKPLFSKRPPVRQDADA